MPKGAIYVSTFLLALGGYVTPMVSCSSCTPGHINVVRLQPRSSNFTRWLKPNIVARMRKFASAGVFPRPRWMALVLTLVNREALLCIATVLLRSYTDYFTYNCLIYLFHSHFHGETHGTFFSFRPGRTYSSTRIAGNPHEFASRQKFISAACGGIAAQIPQFTVSRLLCAGEQLCQG